MLILRQNITFLVIVKIESIGGGGGGDNIMVL